MWVLVEDSKVFDSFPSDSYSYHILLYYLSNMKKLKPNIRQEATLPFIRVFHRILRKLNYFILYMSTLYLFILLVNPTTLNYFTSIDLLCFSNNVTFLIFFFIASCTFSRLVTLQNFCIWVVWKPRNSSWAEARFASPRSLRKAFFLQGASSYDCEDLKQARPNARSLLDVTHSHETFTSF